MDRRALTAGPRRISIYSGAQERLYHHKRRLLSRSAGAVADILSRRYVTANKLRYLFFMHKLSFYLLEKHFQIYVYIFFRGDFVQLNNTVDPFLKVDHTDPRKNYYSRKITMVTI